MLGRADLGSQTSPTLTGKDFSPKAIVYLVYTVLCSLCVKLFDQLLAVFALLYESLANIAPYSFQEKNVYRCYINKLSCLSQQLAWYFLIQNLLSSVFDLFYLLNPCFTISNLPLENNLLVPVRSCSSINYLYLFVNCNPHVYFYNSCCLH